MGKFANYDIDAVTLEFEDTWKKPTEAKNPGTAVTDIEVPGAKEKEKAKEKELEKAEDGQTTKPQQEKENLSPDFSAELTVTAIDFSQTKVFEAINKRKQRRRFSPAQQARLQSVIDKEVKESDLSQEEKILLYKFKRLMQVGEDIPFSEKEYDDLVEAFSKYYKETGKSLPPWLGLTIALMATIGARVSDAVTE